MYETLYTTCTLYLRPPYGEEIWSDPDRFTSKGMSFLVMYCCACEPFAFQTCIAGLRFFFFFFSVLRDIAYLYQLLTTIVFFLSHQNVSFRSVHSIRHLTTTRSHNERRPSANKFHPNIRSHS
ncbi:hypothetical protein LX36DRAFT_47850 [Colletotrichum falcatum]|nr:hypothetical protein LX36DRAFT_47850 [Colletotrichum falcatum]